jgi:foldase protein PrsA
LIRRLAFAAVFTLLVALSVSLAACGGSDLPEGAVAQVGTALVSQEQFETLKSLYEKAKRAPDKGKQPELYRSFERSIVQHLVTMEVLRQEAPGYGITVTDRDVQAEIDKMREMFQGDEERFKAALEKQNLTLEELAADVRDRLLVDDMKAAVTKQVKVTDAEVKAYYDAHKADYTEGEIRKARHILISPFATAAGDEVIVPTEADWETAKAEAERIRSEILNGADFETAAAKYSDDETTAEDGGDLGKVTRGQLVPEFEKAVFSLKKGDVSQPVRTQYGYHIVEVTDITPGKQLAYDEVKEGIRTSLLAELRVQAWETWLAGRLAELGVVYREGLEPVSAPVATAGDGGSSD